MFYSSYLGAIYDDPQEYRQVINKASAAIRSLKDWKTLAVAFRGTSGAAVAYPVSARLGLAMISVRKGSDNSHCYDLVECGPIARKCSGYIIVDDFIGTGATIDKIISDIWKAVEDLSYLEEKELFSHPRAIVLYGQSTVKAKERLLGTWSSDDRRTKLSGCKILGAGVE